MFRRIVSIDTRKLKPPARAMKMRECRFWSLKMSFGTTRRLRSLATKLSQWPKNVESKNVRKNPNQLEFKGCSLGG